MANILGVLAMMTCFIVWFNYRKMTGRIRRIAVSLLGWSIFATLVNVMARAMWAGVSWQEALATQGPAQLIAELGKRLVIDRRVKGTRDERASHHGASVS